VSVYGTSTVKRLSKAQAAALDDALLTIAAQEWPNSVRGMYYMTLAAGLVDKDAQSKRHNYMRVQRRVLKLRRGGRMPYYWITDGSRKVYLHASYDGPEDFADAAADSYRKDYRKDYWMDSPVRVEVWVEKDAMAGKLMPVVRDEFGLGLYVSRGLASETYLQEAAAHIRSDGRPAYVYLLTDFDASGMNIAETVERELVEQARPVVVRAERLAAKPEQIEEYGIISQPVTYTDTSARKFIERFGNETVELDAIPASEVRRLVRDAIERHMDPRRLELLRMVEQEEREGIRALFGGAA
jgi:5S rRNA maturation endonuclease (ribonuclease M5)